MSFILSGVMGWPIAHSLSPRLHGFWLKKYGIEGAYLPLAVKPENLSAAISGLSALGFSGCNITVPHKEAVIPFVDELSARAKRIGAVNTLWFDAAGRLHGDCTDGEGFLADLSAVFPDWKEFKDSVVVIGAGGAARAVLVALHDVGCRNIIVLNRTRERAEVMCSDLGIEAHIAGLDWSGFSPRSLLINTTSLGMKGQPPLTLDLRALSADSLAYDLVYNPAETPFLAASRQQGLATGNGLGMLLHQAVPGFEHWFGVRPEVDDELRAYMKAALPC